MKKCLHLLPMFALLGLALPGLTQDNAYQCPFDEEHFDTIFFIYPQPYIEETMTGGIPDTACVETAYEFTFSISMPDTAVEFNGTEVLIASISFDPETAISYDPPLSDFSYVCDPPSCVFEADSTGCVKIFGTASADEAGEHMLQMTGAVDIGLGIPISIEFPNEALAAGTYSVFVDEAGGENCLIAGVKTLADELSILSGPNPFSGPTQIILDAQLAKRYEFRVIDMLGKVLHREVVQTVQGQNTIVFDGSQLSPGMYFFNLTDGNAVLTRKMMKL